MKRPVKLARMAAVLVPIIVGIMDAPVVRGQIADKPLAFDAASVRPASPNLPDGPMVVGGLRPTGGPGTDDPGRIHYPVVSLAVLLMDAFNVEFRQFKGADGLDSLFFEVNATMPPDTTKEQFRAMLQNLLADRFKLKIHRETKTKESPSFALTIAKGGPKVKESLKTSCSQDGAAPRPALPPQPRPLQMGADGFPVLPPQNPGRAGIAFMQGQGGRVRWIGQRQTMLDLANRLADSLGATVTDATGLTAQYDFVLTFSRESMAVLPPEADTPPDIFGALQSQLGLKLEPKGGIESIETIFVIDHVEKKPSEN